MQARSLLPIVALTSMLAAVPASATTLSDYDVQKAETWADALAICDVTKFLMSAPKLDSEVIIAPVPGGAPVALRGPYFMPPTGFYSEAMKDTFERAQRSGQVTLQAYSAARYRYAKLMLGVYRGTTADEVFLNDQMRLCYALAADASGRARNAKQTNAH